MYTHFCAYTFGDGLKQEQQNVSGVAETLQCIELFVQAYWQALPIKMLKYGQDFQSKQLTAVQDVMDTDAYAVFATEVGQAELDSMKKLGLKVPYLSEWAEKQAASKRLAEGWASDAEPATNDKE